MGAGAVCLEPDAGYDVFDFYDGLLALLRICDAVSCQPNSPLAAWLQHAQGYLNVALKHLPDIGGADFTQSDIAQQWRAANLLAHAVPISARWLRHQLRLECKSLATHTGFYFVRRVLPEEAWVVMVLAREPGDGAGSLWS